MHQWDPSAGVTLTRASLCAWLATRVDPIELLEPAE